VNDLDWELFDRYLAGDLPPAEKERFERWLAERPERAAQAAAFRRAVNELASDVSAEEREAMWAGIAERTGAALPARPTARPASALEPPARPRRRRPQYLAAAAAVAVAVGGALVARMWLSGAAPVELAEERVVTVPRAQQAQFRLPDGTEVLLGGGSTLRHPRAFGTSSREVVLEGEAYFTVEHDARRPFRVRAGDLVATDLGTEFLVRAYPEDGRGRVVVRSGEVAVRAAGDRADAAPGPVVRAGELGRLGAGGAPVVEQADTAAYFAWTRGILMFDATPLREALPQLSRWYDLDFRLSDTSLGSVRLSGTLDRTLTDDRLELIAGSLGLRHTRSGRVVTFSSSAGRSR
jgi:ferric-dicitrate binding protein FerR (iron transport regulator)